MKLAEISNCYRCPNCSGNPKTGGICLLISQNIGIFTDKDRQILEDCPLPDASELIKLRAEVKDLEWQLNNPEL